MSQSQQSEDYRHNIEVATDRLRAAMSDLCDEVVELVNALDDMESLAAELGASETDNRRVNAIRVLKRAGRRP